MAPITESQLKWITEQVERAAEKRSEAKLRRYRNQSLAGFVILLLGVGIAVHGNAVAITDSAQRSTSGRSVICKLITQGDQQTYKYEHEGTLTHLQAQRALKESALARKQLGPAPGCSPTITPETVARP
jgi:hypothetical protein